MKLVEHFVSIQGEGKYTGYTSLFIRLFGCNFTCSGFSSTVGDIPVIDMTNVSSVQDLDGNAFTVGCDSRYAWSSEFAHLYKDYSVDELSTFIKVVLADNGVNHLVITGGEPMMHQNDLCDLIGTFIDIDYPLVITIETNASIHLKEENIAKLYKVLENPNLKILFSNSPKLAHSGEALKQRIRGRHLFSQLYLASIRPSAVEIQYKFVCGNEQHILEVFDYLKSYDDELADGIKGTKKYALSKYGLATQVIHPITKKPVPADDFVWDNFLLYVERHVDEVYRNVMIMPLAANIEQYRETAPRIAHLCIKHNLPFCGRLHLELFGNKVGT